MAETAQAYDAHPLAWSGAEVLEGRIDRDAAAHHGRSFIRRNIFRDLDDEMAWYAGIVGISSHGLAALFVYAAKRVNLLRAELLLALRAWLTLGLPARVGLGAHADSIADSRRRLVSGLPTYVQA